MTYKHVKFQDSETMRSLVKIAHQKGMIAPESSVEKALKSASAKPALDLSVTDSVQENLLKLCAGLRAAGLTTYANKIEGHIATIKFAETAALYDVSGETGEDLMDEAHPEGAVEVADADDGHGVVDTKPSAHQKLLDIVTKAQVINSLKLALAEGLPPAGPPTATPEDMARANILQAATELKNVITNILNKEPDISEIIYFAETNHYTSWSTGASISLSSAESHLESFLETLDKAVASINKKTIASNIKPFSDLIASLVKLINKIDAIPRDHKNAYIARVQAVSGNVSHALEALTGSNNSLKATVPTADQMGSEPLTNLTTKIADLKNRMSELNLIITNQNEFTKEEKDKGLAWLSGLSAQVDEKKKSLDSLPPGDHAKVISLISGQIDQMVKSFEAFNKIWG